MIGNHDCCGAFIDCSLCVFRSQHTFNDDWAWPQLPEPAQIFPSHYRFSKCGSYVDKRHRPFARFYDVLQIWCTAIEEKTGKPPRVGKNLWNVRNFGEYRTA